MFLAGADGQTPELRAPSIKGAMRFWWRACNGHLGVEDLREKEEGIFGGVNSGVKSRILIRVIKPPIQTSVIEMLPHKENQRHRSPQQCFPEDEEFEIKISLLSNQSIRLTQVKCLFELCAFLGGLGKRSRRGLGSFKILKINGEEYQRSEKTEFIQSLIKEVNPEFSYSSSAEYPIIQEIKISERKVSVFEIGKATHDEKGSSNSYKYEATLGAGRPRFASPVYISTLPSGRVIVTTLKTISPKPRDVEMRIQRDLKEKILS